MLHKNVSHQWTFERIGGFDQVKLSTDADWQHLSELDTKLWAVLSCPTQQLSLEQKTLKRLDKDADGRIRVNELTLAIQCVCDALQQPSFLARRQAILPLDALRSDTELGQNLTALAVLLLDSSQDKTIITLEQVESAMTLFSQQPFNGDGVITRDAIHSEEILAAFEEVIHCVGSREDISGKQGIDSDLLDVFTAAVEDRLAWMALAEQSNVLVLEIGRASCRERV